MSQQRSAESVSIDDIPVDIATTQSDTVESDDIPKEIESITRGLASEHPPTNVTNSGNRERFFVRPEGVRRVLN